MSIKRLSAEIVLLLFGIFLVVDRIFLHLISFKYSSIGLAVLDPWFDHWMIGLVLIAVSLYDLHLSGKI